MFLFTEHKPIYLKQDDLTIELVKEPVYFEVEREVNRVGMGDVIKYLGEQRYGMTKEEELQDGLFLRVDQLKQYSNDST